MADLSMMTAHDARIWVQRCADLNALRVVSGADVRETVQEAAAQRLRALERSGVVFCVAYPRPGQGEHNGDHADRIKAILPVWKREHYVDGEPTWVSNAEFTPEDPA